MFLFSHRKSKIDGFGSRPASQSLIWLFLCFLAFLSVKERERGRERNTELIIQTSGPSNYSPYPSNSFPKTPRVLNSASGALWSSQRCFCVSAAFEYGLWNVQLAGK